MTRIHLYKSGELLILKDNIRYIYM